MTERTTAPVSIHPEASSLDQLHDLLDLSADYSYVCKVEDTGILKLEWASQNFLELIGYKKNDNVFDLLEALVHPEERFVIQHHQDELRSGNIATASFRIRKPDGSYICVEDRVKPYLDKNGKLYRVAGISRDITAQRNALVNQRKSEQRFNEVLSSSPQIIFRFNLTTNCFDYVSDSVQHVLGTSLEEAHSFTVTDILNKVHPDDRDQIISIVDAAHDQNRKEIHFDLRWQCPGGNYQWLSIWSAILADESGKNEAVVGVILDITKRKETEQALKESEELHRNIVENANDIICINDTEGRFISISPAFQRLTSFLPEEWIGKKWVPLIYAPDRELVQEKITNCLNGITSEPFEFRLMTLYGELISLESIMQPLIFDKKIRGIVSINRDVTEAAKMTKRLERSQKRYSLAAEAGKTGIWEVNLGTSEFYIDDQSCKLVSFNVPNNYIDFKDLKRYIFKKDRKSVLLQMRQFEDKRIIEINLEFRIKDGTAEPKWVLLRGRKIPEENTGRRLVAGTITDITERKKAELMQLESESLSRKFIEMTSEGIMMADETGNIIEWNDAQERVSGVKRSDVLGKKLWDIQDISAKFRTEKNSDWLEEHKVKLKRLLVTGTGDLLTPALEGQIIHKDGSIKTLMQSTFSIKTDKGYVLGVLTRDITERVKMEKKLRESEEKYRLLVENMTDIIISLDNKGLIRFASPSYISTVGGNAEKAIGSRFESIIYTEDRGRFLEAFQQVVSGTQSVTFEIRVLSQSEWIWMSWNLTSIVIADQVVNILGVGRDTTLQKKAEIALINAKQKAEDANKAKEIFLSNTTHELRTPLTAIIGLSELILDNNVSSEIRNMVQQTISESENLLVIINDILDHIQLKEGSIRLNYKTISMKRLFAGLNLVLTPQFKKNKLEFICITDNNVPEWVVGDPVRIKQILYNLIWNGMKFTKTGSVTLHVQAKKISKRKATLKMSVTDTGIGIPKDKIQDVFESFFQVEGSRTRIHGGTGLGLTIAKSLVEKMGGEMGLESEIGKGSTFWFTMPLDLPDSAEILRLEDESDQVGKKTRKKRSDAFSILLVEDYRPNQQILMTHLMAAGYKVDVAETGKQAVDTAKETKYDIILMDVMMPEMDGLEATNLIRTTTNINQRTPILALTATTYLEELDKCMTIGMNDVVPKPISRDTLVKTIEKWTNGHAASKEKHAPNIKNAAKLTYSTFSIQELEKDFQEGYLNLLQIQSEQLEQQMERMIEAFKNRDLAVLRTEVHGIKSSAAFLQLRRLAAIAKKISDQCYRHDTAGLDTLIEELQDETNLFKNDLRSLEQFLQTDE